MTIKKTGIQTLKAFHLLFISIWVGSWLCLLLLLLADLNNAGISQILEKVTLIHSIITSPSVIGSLVTGILFSATTNWGFFKHHWITIKYAINIFPIIGGALIFLPHIRAMIDIAKNNPSDTLSNPTFIYDRNVAIIFLGFEFALFGFALYLSVFKPILGRNKAVH